MIHFLWHLSIRIHVYWNKNYFTEKKTIAQCCHLNCKYAFMKKFKNGSILHMYFYFIFGFGEKKIAFHGCRQIYAVFCVLPLSVSRNVLSLDFPFRFVMEGRTSTTCCAFRRSMPKQSRK